MRTINRTMAIAAVMGLTLGFAPGVLAYHDGGVAYCDGCHTMHNSKGGVAVKGTQFQGQVYLLQGTDQSSTCLNCHASSAATPSGYHIMTFPIPAAGQPPVNLTPGGDFAYLSKAYPASGHGAPSPGERHGHNVVAADFGLVADSTLHTSPGGSYAAANLTCISCHNPHSNARIVDAAGTIAYNTIGAKTLPISGSGSYGAQPTATDAVGVYRFLGGKNYVPVSYAGGPAFTADPPIAVAPSSYNQSEATNEVRVAYGKGMSEWCANCHAAIHNGNTGSANSALIHPAGANALLTAATSISGSPTTIAAIYNAYKSTGDLSGTQAGSYTSLVPYEEGAASTTAGLLTHASNAGGYLAGPTTGNENVMCLTCHRAHASGFSSMTRWNNGSEMITIAGAWPGSDSTNASAKSYADGKTMAEYSAAMYNHPATQFATYQRSLCNKCHAKD